MIKMQSSIQIPSVVASNTFTCVRSISSLRPLAGFPVLSQHAKKGESLTPPYTPLLMPSRCPEQFLGDFEDNGARGQKKLPKLNKKLYGGGDNGGLDYGFQVMDWHRKGKYS